MAYFEMPVDDYQRQYAEKLDYLMAHWENEVVEFKEAKASKDTDEIGSIFLRSATRQTSDSSRMDGLFSALARQRKSI